MAHIVVGVDSSRTSQRALRWALEEADRRGESLTTVLVWHEPVSLEVPLDSVTSGALRYDVRSGRRMPATTALALPGDPGRVLVQQAEGAALLVLGPRHHVHPFRSVSSYCLRNARTPVVVVRTDPDRLRGRVVVGLDGSAAAQRALVWAAAEAQGRDAELVVVHAWQRRPTALRDLAHPRRARRQQQRRATERLSTWVTQLLGPDATALADLKAEHGSPLDRLLEHAEAADLVVLGGQTHHAPLRLLLGSVGGQLAQHCPCPVVVVPSS
jgi:nucleotide-binding universal stress UspA family protein